MRIRRSNILLLAAVIILTTCAVSRADSMKSPWSVSETKYWKDFDIKKPATNKKREKRYVTNPAKIPLLWGLKFYQNFISSIDGDKCGMYPTCSGYSARAIRKHGAVIGLAMTGDRLLHEGDELKRAPLIKKYGVFRYHDPLINNDFWFTE